MLFAVPLQVKSIITPQPDMSPSSPFLPQRWPTARQRTEDPTSRGQGVWQPSWQPGTPSPWYSIGDWRGS